MLEKKKAHHNRLLHPTASYLLVEETFLVVFVTSKHRGMLSLDNLFAVCSLCIALQRTDENKKNLREKKLTGRSID